MVWVRIRVLTHYGCMYKQLRAADKCLGGSKYHYKIQVAASCVSPTSVVACLL